MEEEEIESNIEDEEATTVEEVEVRVRDTPVTATEEMEVIVRDIPGDQPDKPTQKEPNKTVEEMRFERLMEMFQLMDKKMDSNSETLKQNKEDMEKMDKKMDSNNCLLYTSRCV